MQPLTISGMNGDGVVTGLAMVVGTGPALVVVGPEVVPWPDVAVPVPVTGAEVDGITVRVVCEPGIPTQ